MTTRSLNLGINLNANVPYGCAGAWSDVTRAFSGWFAPAGVTGEWTADAYPLANGMQSDCKMIGCPAGVYKLSFQGTATLAVKWATMSNVAKGADGTTTADVTIALPNQEIFFTATGLIAADPLRNMHLNAPGYYASKMPFRIEFTSWLKPFTVIRAIDWAGVNTVKATATMAPVTWASRVSPTGWDQTTRGVAYEYFLSLARQVGSAPWINIPYLADDDYVTQLATLVASFGLPLCYVELSNEVWNAQFGQWLQNWNTANPATGASAFDGNITAAGVTPGATNATIRAHRCYAERARHVGQIFRTVLGSKVKVVLAGQTVNPAVIGDGLAWLAAKFGDVKSTIDCISPAAYFPALTPPVGTTLATMAAQCSAYIAGDLTTGLNGHKVLADKYGVELIGYEGGQSLQSWSGANKTIPLASPTDTPWVLQNDPQMGVVYTAWLNACQSAGMTLVMHNSFIGPPAGSWIGSLASTINESPGVKYQVISAFAAIPHAPPIVPTPPPPVIPSVPIPGTISGVLTVDGAGLKYAATLTPMS